VPLAADFVRHHLRPKEQVKPMNPTELIGYSAAALTTIAFIPQVLHTWRMRSGRGVSLGMYTTFTSGVALWLIYGILLDAWPIIVANVITLSLALSILAMKIRYR
jgi:MtN3 and saliva related transmembrane protein